jgi:hypothetical protein
MFKTLRFGLGLALLLGLPAACSSGDSDATATATDALRPLTKEEALAELGQVGAALRANYGPLAYKKARYGFDLDAALGAARTEIEAASDEAGRVRAFYRLLAGLKDGHVSLSWPVRATETVQSSLSVFFTPVAGSYVVFQSYYEPALGITRGDRLVSVDGLTPAEIEELSLPFAEIGTPESTRHQLGLAMTQRPFYAPKELQPRAPNATVVLERADGTIYSVEVPWFAWKGGAAGGVFTMVSSEPVAMGLPVDAAYSGRLGGILDAARRAPSPPGEAPPQATTFERGATTPFFLTPEVRERLGVVEVKPKPETLAAFGVNAPPDPETVSDWARTIPIRGFKYRFGGKTILLVRIPGFTVPKGNFNDNVGWLAALLKDNLPAPAQVPPPVNVELPEPTLEMTPADVVVVDVTHNPGGAVPYVQGLASLFATAPVPNFVQASRADRLILASLLAQANANASDAAVQSIFVERIRRVEEAHDIGNLLGPFLPLSGSYYGPTFPMTGASWAGTEMLDPNPLVTWPKPVLVLHDELSGSGGDAFPLILQNSGVARTFGARTAGQGGSVQPILTLPYSGATLRLTRGLFGVHEAGGSMRLVENVGVSPDFPYEHTIPDFRAGFVGYATAFSEIASKLTR